MPVERVRKNDRTGYRWGKTGRVYFYTPGDKASRERAKKRAQRQGAAVKSRQR